VMREAERTVAAQLVMRIKILGDNEINNPSFCRCYFFFFIFLLLFGCFGKDWTRKGEALRVMDCRPLIVEHYQYDFLLSLITHEFIL
jgi:hypothetical protein